MDLVYLLSLMKGGNGYDALIAMTFLLMTSFFIVGEIKIRFSKPAR